MTERETATRAGAPRAGRADGRAPVAGSAPADSAPADSAPADSAPADSETAGGETAGRPAGFSRVAPVLRRHWLIGALLLAGLLLRVLAQVAYQPALIYVNTLKYLYGASPGADPMGYMVILRGILTVGNLSVVAAIQHLLGLGLGLALYIVLLRQGAPRWLAALAAAPVLLDSYQVQIEQTIMPDIWFEALVVAGLCDAALAPRGHRAAGRRAGLVLGCSALVRQIGEVLILPALVYLLVRGGGLRLAAVRAAALCVAFALPVLSYCAVSYAKTGNFWLARGQTMTGRLTAVADCATLRLPAELRPLCPTPAEQAHGPDWLEHSGHSPLHLAPIPPGADRNQLIAELGAAVEHQQPLLVARSIARDSVRLFALTRTPNPWVTPVSRWQFQTHYPTYPPWVTLGPGNTIVVGLQHHVFGRFFQSPLKPHYGGPAHVSRPVATFLRSYQLDGGYTPGPALALLALLAVAGSVLALFQRGASPRTRRLALACLLFTGTAAVLLLAPDLYEFSWRYELPAVVTLPPAGCSGWPRWPAGSGTGRNRRPRPPGRTRKRQPRPRRLRPGRSRRLSAPVAERACGLARLWLSPPVA